MINYEALQSFGAYRGGMLYTCVCVCVFNHKTDFFAFLYKKPYLREFTFASSAPFLSLKFSLNKTAIKFQQ